MATIKSKELTLDTRTIKMVGVIMITYFGYKIGAQKGDATAGTMFGTAVGNLVMDLILD